MITLFQALGLNVVLIIALMCLGYFFREGIKNFFSEKILEKQKEHNEARDKKQQDFEKELSKQNATLQKELQTAIEKQRTEFQKELKAIEYKNSYYNKILDRRINAYEKLNEIVLEATLISKINSYEFYSLFYSYAKFSEHYSRLKVLSKYFIWYSPNIVELLNKYIMLISYMNAYYLGSKSALIKFLQESNIDDSRIITIKTDLDKIYIDPPKDRVVIPCDTKITSIGIICHETIQSLHCEIIRDFNDDLRNLYKIEDFFCK